MAKRILIYTNHFYPEEFKINEIVKWLSTGNTHIRVLTGLPNYPNGKIIKKYPSVFKNNIIINRLFLIPRGNGSNFRLVINYLTYFISCFFFTIYIAIFKKKYDIIFVHHTSPILIAIHPILYGLFKKTKRILWDLDIWPESLIAVNAIKSDFIISTIKLCVKWIYSKYDIILVGSKPLKEIIKQRYNGKIFYFPNWADKVIEDNKINKNYSFTFNPDKFNIIYPGNIGKAQNFENLVRTIELVNENIHWIFVGDGRNKISFKKLLEQKQIDHKATFINQVSVDIIPSIVSKANALFLSLKNDEIFSKTVPAKLQTYMALGKPIIAVLNGEGAKLIIESNCGLLEKNYDYEKLAININAFANKREAELIHYGDNAKDYYQKYFNSLKRKEEILNLLYE